MQKLDTYLLWQSLMSEMNVQQNGQIRPVSDFLAWLNKISYKIFRERVATDELSQLYADDLSPFRKTINVRVQRLDGQPFDFIQVPSDYESFANAKVIRQLGSNECICDPQIDTYENGRCVPVIDEQYAEMKKNFLSMHLTEIVVTKIDVSRWPSCLAHPYKGPTMENPKITQTANGFYIAPKGISSIVLDYYRTPAAATFNYTYGTDDIVIYNAATSTPLEWSNTMFDVFMTELRKIYAAHIGDGEIYQMTAADSKTTI